MKYLKILLGPVKVKGSEDDMETLQLDLYDKISAMIESETLKWEIDPETDEDEDESY
jgi:hypothetical protein